MMWGIEMARSYGKVLVSSWVGMGALRALRANGKAQMLYLYLHTCPSSKGTGIYYLSGSCLRDDLGFDDLDATTALSTLSTMGYIEYDYVHSYIYVHNMAVDTYGPVLRAHSRAWCALVAELRTDIEHPFVGKFVQNHMEEYALGSDPNLALVAARLGITDEPEAAPAPAKAPDAGTPNKYSANMLDVWQHWLELHQQSGRKGPKPNFGDKRKRVLRARLQDGYDVATLKAAADGMWASKWHRDEGQISFELCFRDNEHVEKFSTDRVGAPPTAVKPEADSTLKSAGWSFATNTGLYYHDRHRQPGWVTLEEALGLQLQHELTMEHKEVT